MESVFKFWKNMERKTRELLPMQVFPAQVKEVAEEERTCTVRVNDNVDFFDVKLYAVTDKSLKGFCLIPAIDSTVLVARIANGNDLYVCSFSEVDKVLGTIGDNTSLTVENEHIELKTEKVTVDVSGDKVSVDAEEISLQFGDGNGMLTTKKLADTLKNLIEKFNGHTHMISSIQSKVAGTAATAESVAVPATKNTADALV